MLLQNVHNFCSGLWAPGGPDQDLVDAVVDELVALKLASAQSMFLDCVSVLNGRQADNAIKFWQQQWPEDHITSYELLTGHSLVSERDGALVVLGAIEAVGRSIILNDVGADKLKLKPDVIGGRIWVNHMDDKVMGLKKVRRMSDLRIAGIKQCIR